MDEDSGFVLFIIWIGVGDGEWGGNGRLVERGKQRRTRNQ